MEGPVTAIIEKAVQAQGYPKGHMMVTDALAHMLYRRAVVWLGEFERQERKAKARKGPRSSPPSERQRKTRPPMA